MKVITHIPTLFESDVGAALFSELIKMYPEGRRGPRSFRLFLPSDDSRTAAVLDALHRGGFTRWRGEPRTPDARRQYEMDLLREYDESDYRSAEYLMLRPKHALQGGFRTEEGSIILGPRDLDQGWDFARVDPGQIVVPTRVKDFLENSGLRGLHFRPTVLDDDCDGPPERVAWGGKFGEPWWELRSQITLPPLAPSLKVTDPNMNPLPRGSKGPVRIVDGPYRGFELHYLRRELKEVPEFDLAQSLEWSGPAPTERFLVASRRFYEFCKQKRLKCEYVPVRIDEG